MLCKVHLAHSFLIKARGGLGVLIKSFSFGDVRYAPSARYSALVLVQNHLASLVDCFYLAAGVCLFLLLWVGVGERGDLGAQYGLEHYVIILPRFHFGLQLQWFGIAKISAIIRTLHLMPPKIPELLHDLRNLRFLVLMAHFNLHSFHSVLHAQSNVL